jgi:predicted ATP-dependent protease
MTGKQGVIIPALNVGHLMLKDEVIKAVKKGKFHVWAVSTVDEGIEILTGKKAGKQNKNGKYPKGTVNDLVDKKLREYSAKFTTLGAGKKKSKKKTTSSKKVKKKK